ncbi:hypothetical protein BpHYR1_040092 [Brachionus plicatilis]|uniref:Uncharacterized protein n=1 Tax=Brachionus plicatilis TaxID=10195 RepID=A0A3M7S4T5_BRAPC|nr:hypothetical protein BpHYR1_040092 [Brachionus plicatilis]
MENRVGHHIKNQKSKFIKKNNILKVFPNQFSNVVKLFHSLLILLYPVVIRSFAVPSTKRLDLKFFKSLPMILNKIDWKNIFYAIFNKILILILFSSTNVTKEIKGFKT